MDAPEGDRPRVAYVMTRFPKITETFVLLEMLALEEQGFQVDVFPLLRGDEEVGHAEVRRLQRSVRHHGFLTWPAVAAHLGYLRRAPLKYAATLLEVIARTLPSPNFLAGALAFLPKSALIAREVERAGVTHVHAHFSNHPALVALIVHRLTGVPFSFTAHGSDLHVDQTALAWKLSQAAFAVTVSEYNREFVRERLGNASAEALTVLHCGVDPELYAPAPEPATEEFQILCVASFREVKGHRFLIEACRILHQGGTSLLCHLVGAGPLEGEITAAIRRSGIADRFVLHGPLPRARVVERMQASHVVVLPSAQDRRGRREGIPVTLMEAMSCGRPVVASRISGIPELVEDGRSGLLTPPGDPQALAAALARLASAPALRASLGREARERVLAEFDQHASARRLARLILRSSRGPTEVGVPTAVPAPARLEGSPR